MVLHTFLGESRERRGDMQRLSLVFGLTLAFAFVEFLGAYLSHSISLASDGVHMMGDVGGIGLAWTIGHVTHQMRNSSASERLKMLGAYTNGILLVLVSLGIAGVAIWRFSHPFEIRSQIMMGVAGGGLMVNVISLLLLSNLQKRDLNLRGAYRHIQSDALTSFGVIVGAGLISLTGKTFIDSLLGIAVACFIMWRAQDLIRDAGRTLVGESFNTGALEELVRSFAGVSDTHNLHIDSVNGSVCVTLHLVTKGKRPNKVVARVREGLARRGIHAVTIEQCTTRCPSS